MADIKTQSESLSFEKVWEMFQETGKRFQETDKKFQETDRILKATDKQISELGKQIGGLGNKFGTFNEGLFMPSLEKILENKFNCKKITSNYKSKNNGETFEADLVGVSEDSCYIIEIKSHLKEEVIEQLSKIIEKFRKHATEYSDKKLYGIIAATHYDASILSTVQQSGFYFISTSDDLAKLKTLRNFEPKFW